MEETFQKVANGDQHDQGSKNRQLDAIVIETAARKWVKGFNCIPSIVISKLYQSGDEIVEITPPTLEIREDVLPMWGTMFSFDHPLDNKWLDDPKNLRAMANCGFRIYAQQDYGYIFGMDGGGYDFYEAHWIPLYKARGLRWHGS